MLKLPISAVKLNDDNPRILKDARFQQLIKSIQDFPQMLELRPCVVDENHVVLGGNMRLRAMQHLGFTEVAVVVAEGLSEAQKREFVIKDNGSYGVWDFDALANGDWPDAATLNDWGMDVPPDWGVVELPAAEEGEPDLTPPSEPITVVGDLYELNAHRLHCADSTDSDAVNKLMAGRQAELLFTSPPYSDQREYNGNKDLGVDTISEFIPTYLPFCNYQVVNLGLQRKDGELFCYWDEYIDKARACGYKLLGWNVWNRSEPRTMGQQSAFIPIAHEWLFVFGLDFKDINKTVECKTAGKATKGMIRGKNDELQSRAYTIDDFKKINSVTTTGVESSGLHPAMFPVDLPLAYVEAVTNRGDIVAEPFSGGGTTLMACEQAGRLCYGQELDPQYADIIVRRWLRYMADNNRPATIKRNGTVLTPAELADFTPAA